MAVLKKGARITGSERTKLATDLRKAYDKGKSIRELAETHGRSYGFVHRVLTESGATLRGRGGAPRPTKKGNEPGERGGPDPARGGLSRRRSRPGRHDHVGSARPAERADPVHLDLAASRRPGSARH